MDIGDAGFRRRNLSADVDDFSSVHDAAEEVDARAPARRERMQNQTQMTPGTAWVLTLAAAAILMITMGARLTTGLFVSPINTSTGLGIVSIGFAMAVGQFMWASAPARNPGSKRHPVPGRSAGK